MLLNDDKNKELIDILIKEEDSMTPFVFIKEFQDCFNLKDPEKEYEVREILQSNNDIPKNIFYYDQFEDDVERGVDDIKKILDEEENVIIDKVEIEIQEEVAKSILDGEFGKITDDLQLELRDATDYQDMIEEQVDEVEETELTFLKQNNAENMEELSEAFFIYLQIHTPTTSIFYPKQNQAQMDEIKAKIAEAVIKQEQAFDNDDDEAEDAATEEIKTLRKKLQGPPIIDPSNYGKIKELMKTLKEHLFYRDKQEWGNKSDRLLYRLLSREKVYPFNLVPYIKPRNPDFILDRAHWRILQLKHADKIKSYEGNRPNPDIDSKLPPKKRQDEFLETIRTEVNSNQFGWNKHLDSSEKTYKYILKNIFDQSNLRPEKIDNKIHVSKSFKEFLTNNEYVTRGLFKELQEFRTEQRHLKRAASMPAPSTPPKLKKATGSLDSSPGVVKEGLERLGEKEDAHRTPLRPHQNMSVLEMAGFEHGASSGKASPVLTEKGSPERMDVDVNLSEIIEVIRDNPGFDDAQINEIFPQHDIISIQRARGEFIRLRNQNRTGGKKKKRKKRTRRRRKKKKKRTRRKKRKKKRSKKKRRRKKRTRRRR